MATSEPAERPAAAVAGLDVVRSVAEAEAQPRPPLLVLDPLEAHFDEHGIGSGPIAARPIGDGHSNVTFLLVRGEATVVLRRPPRPPFPPSAHDVLREARILQALAGTPVPVPRVLLACEDATILGVPFYVMDHVDGVVASAQAPPALASPEHRLAMGTALVDVLAALHAVDWRALGLEGFGRPAGYAERQVRRFASLWEETRTRELPAVDEVGRWLAERVPPAQDATIVHGDYRIGNVMFGRAAPARMLAVLDWEMATLGDPLADLGYFTATYARPGEAPNAMTDLSAATRERGFPEREDLARRYATRTGRSIELLGWYQVLALWKACVFLEGSYRRYRAGTTDDAWFATLGERVPQLAETARRLAVAADAS
jgi:aminoglycoside phosphotransferase (APT) family kinase protein